MMRLKRLVLLSVMLSLPLAAIAQGTRQELNDQLWEAARKGDAVAVKTLLDKGADVNAKFRYGATALSYASDKGHTEVVKVLLERGADVNVRDTFYQTTPLQWAATKGHAAIVKALLDKGAEGVDDVLMMGARSGNAEFVRIALAKGGAKPETLTAALSASAGDEKKTEIAEMLKKAGAAPAPEIAVEILQTYAGKYKSEQGLDVNVMVKDGKLFLTPLGQPPFALAAIDKSTFRPVDFDGVTIIFNVEGGKTASFTFKRDTTSSIFKKIE